MIDKYSHKKVIVVTHHLPSMKLIAEKYNGDIINYAFATDVEHLMKNNVTHFCSGHTHSSMDKIIGTTRCIVNPKGYLLSDGTSENPNYNKEFVFEIKDEEKI